MDFFTNEEKINNLQAILISLFLTFTLFIFAPIESYISNQYEFWFELKELIGFIIGGGIMCFLLFYLLMRKAPQKLRLYINAAVFGLALAFYVQGNFLVINYGVMDGTEIDWSSYGSYGIINAVIWIACILVPIIFVYFQKKIFQLTSIGISAFFTLIQAVTLITLFVTVGLTPKNNVLVTTEGAFDVSKNKNIAVFVVDTMDAAYFEAVLEEYPETKDTFADFTYYANTMGMYPTTKGALPHIMTGIQYKNEQPFNDYIKEAWKNTPLLDELKNNGFTTGMYSSTIFFTPDVEIMNIKEGISKVSSHIRLFKRYKEFIFFKYFPHSLKKNHMIEIGDINALKKSMNSYELYSTDTKKLDDLLSQNPIKLVENNTFRLYHYMGSHPPFILNENLEEVGLEDSSSTKQTKGSLKIIEDYIVSLKVNKLYEDSMLIILADHGAHDTGGLRQHPALLIKYPNVSHPFQISNASISYSDILPTLLSHINTEYKLENETIPGIDALNLTEREREYLYYDWDNSTKKQYLPVIRQYFLNEHAGTFNFIKVPDAIFSEKSISPFPYLPYKFGSKISFSNREDRESILGISSIEGIGQEAFSWSLDNETNIYVDSEKPDSDVLLSLNIGYILGNTQKIQIYVNDVFVSERTVTSSNVTIQEIIPQNIFEDGHNIIKFKYPNSASPQELNLGGENMRRLAFQLKNLILDSKNIDQFRLNIGTHSVVEFGEDGNNQLLFLDNWNPQEEIGLWTREVSTLKFYSKNFNDIRLIISGWHLNNSFSTQVILNNELVGTLDKFIDGKSTIILPKELLSSDSQQVLTLYTPDAKSPKELGINEDTRTLGVYVSSMEFNILK